MYCLQAHFPVVLESDDNTIHSFIAKIGQEIKIENERDQEVVNHLIEYIDSLETDKSNLIKYVSHGEEEHTKMQHQIQHLKEEITKLTDENKLHAQVLHQQKEDFVETLKAANEMDGLGSPTVETLESLESLNLLNNNQVKNVKATIEEQRLENYKNAIDSHAHVELYIY